MIWKIWMKCDICKIWKKGKLKSEKILKIWSCKLNSEKIWKIRKKIVK